MAKGGSTKPESAQASRAPKKHKVVYLGSSDVRTISKGDFKQNGFTIQKDLVWNRENEFTLELSLPDNALEFLRSQPEFGVK